MPKYKATAYIRLSYTDDPVSYTHLWSCLPPIRQERRKAYP